jgi:hypothetical protein
MISVPVRSRRAQRGQFVQKLQHAVPSVVLLMDGVRRLRDNAHGESLLLAIAEVTVSVLVIGFMARAARRLRAGAAPDHGGGGHHIDWIDICLAAMLTVEALMHQHETGHLPRPTILLAVTMLALGLMHGRLAAFRDRRRTLRITDEGVSVPGRFFKRLTLPWDQVARVEIDTRNARIVAVDGREQRIDFGDVLNVDAVREALAQASARLEAREAAEVIPTES